MQLASKFAIATALYIDTLIDTEADQIKWLFHCRRVVYVWDAREGGRWKGKTNKQQDNDQLLRGGASVYYKVKTTIQ
jgi:hypothetical protein